MRALILLLFIFYISNSDQLLAQKLKNLVNNYHQVSLGGNNDSISIYYTGCGGYLIKDKTSGLMLDPYFSNITRMLLVPCKKIKTDSVEIDRFFTRIFNTKKDDKGVIKAIMVAHSHYDHMADVHCVYRENCDTISTKIIGGNTTKNILNKYNINSLSIDNNDDLKDIQCIGEEGFIWIEKDKIRVLPILSEHAPHFCGLKFLPKRKLTEPPKKKPLKAKHLPEGESFNYLIDFLDEKGEVKFRIFSNAGSACNENVGFPPEELIKKRKVDVLFLCVASFGQVDGYPETLIEYLNPKFIVLNHWENFFKPYGKLDPENPKTVPGTNIKKFINKLENLKEIKPKYIFPMPLTEIVFIY